MRKESGIAGLVDPNSPRTRKWTCNGEGRAFIDPPSEKSRERLNKLLSLTPVALERGKYETYNSRVERTDAQTMAAMASK